MTRRHFVQDNPLENPKDTVWLESLLKAPGVRYDGNLVFSPRKAIVNGERFEHAMTVDVKDDPLGSGQACGMSIPVKGKFLRFEATVGRDDEETRAGTGFCYFEVYGDSKLLFRSEAHRSKLYPVIVDDGRGKTFRPQKLEVDVKGVRLLRLVVRYANDFKQKATFSTGAFGDHVKLAAGCVWCDAKLTTGEGASLDTAKLRERDERIKTAAKLAAKTLKRQLETQDRPGRNFAIGLLPIRDESRVSPDDALIRPQLAKVFFSEDEGRSLGTPLPPDKATDLREKLTNFSPKSLRDIARAAQEGRYAGAPYLIGGHIEDEKLLLVLIDTRPDDGLIVAKSTGWLSPP